MTESWVFDLVASFSISGKKSVVGTSASVTMVRCVSQPRGQRFGIGGELIRRLQQDSSALQQHTAHVGEFCSMTGAVKQHHVQLLFQFFASCS
nr:Uncharacterised protein [Raoultella sp. NCTC 9187]